MALTLCAYITIMGLFAIGSSGAVIDKPEAGKETVTAHICPHFCTVGWQILCEPPPCPPPACVDPALHKPTDCCEYCPNGPDCRAPDGSIILYKHWKIVDGKNCTCTDIGSGKTTCV